MIKSMSLAGAIGALRPGNNGIVYLIGKRLYRNSRLGLLATLFSAFAVLQIQLSHYFTVDNFANFFTYGAVYIAVCIATHPASLVQKSRMDKDGKLPAWLTGSWGSFILYALFAVYTGWHASKVSIWRWHYCFLWQLSCSLKNQQRIMMN
jgi:hypothetical protein